jgi:hypothetical protein
LFHVEHFPPNPSLAISIRIIRLDLPGAKSRNNYFVDALIRSRTSLVFVLAVSDPATRQIQTRAFGIGPVRFAMCLSTEAWEPCEIFSPAGAEY